MQDRNKERNQNAGEDTARGRDTNQNQGGFSNREREKGSEDEAFREDDM